MTKINRIFIVGPMAAGKAMLSEALAQKLDWQFVDANPSLERYVGLQLNEILGEAGEAAFHRCETQMIKHYLQQENIVMLLEEAVIVSRDNRELLSSEFVVYLKVSTQEQIERMKNGRIPLLPIKDLNKFLEKQHNERDHLYESVAKLIIEPSSIENDVDKIINTINSR